MSLDFINKHVAKILLATQDGDSINRISQKIGASYSYTYEWINRLEEIGVVERDNGIQITDSNFTHVFEEAAKTVLQRDMELDDAYLLPNFAGMDYRFSKTDAVYIWTKGGYQIGRNQKDYPIFIDVYNNEIEEWQEFFHKFGVETSIEERTDQEGIHYVLYPQEEMEIGRVESASVTPLEETVEWAEQYRANFQPALEMLDEMYDLDLDAEYRERRVM